jgi:molybdenum cofactor cytidylyltransferase
MRTFALIPAAGKSTRMGQPKLALPLGGRTVLERVVGMLKEAGIQEILVVLGPQGADLAPLAKASGAQVAVLAQETAHMRETIEHGLDELQARYQPGNDDFWLLVPADSPTVSAEVVRALLHAASQDPKASVFVPCYRDQRGHPALVRWRYAAGLRLFPKDQGLNAYLRRLAAQTHEVAVSDPEILRDLNTPEDYERVTREVGHEGSM